MDVTIINKDTGISKPVKYNYEFSQPAVKLIKPAQGRKRGNDEIHIYGSGFAQGKLTIYKSATAVEEKPMPVVRFGSIRGAATFDMNQQTARIEVGEDGVTIKNKLIATYRVDEDGNKTVAISLITGEGVFENTFEYDFSDEKDSIRYIPVELLKDITDATKAYTGYELLRISYAGTTFRVERGYSPRVVFDNSQHLVVYTPSYHENSKVDVTIVNPDTGTVTVKDGFEYRNPASNPKIIDILREGESQRPEEVNGKTAKIIRLPIQGGHEITIIGDDFDDAGTLDFIGPGDKQFPKIPNIKYEIKKTPNKIIFTMPAIPEKDVVLNQMYKVVIHQDGAQTSSEDCDIPIYFVFVKGETDPKIESVSPDKGPSSGGTTVTITGRDFRKTMEDKIYEGKSIKVSFGGVPVKGEITVSANRKEIIVVTPPGTPGKVSIKVENPDGMIVELKDAFTYLSNPRITGIVDGENDRIPIDVISVEGGQRIKILGSDFMEGAKVIFNPVLRKAGKDDQGKGEIITINGEDWILESGIDGTEVKWISPQSLTVLTPQGKVDTKGIIVINPDKGATPIYQNIRYGLPEIGAPQQVTAELVYDRYIKINWKGVTGATEYEIYVIIDDKIMEFVGSTELTSYVYDRLEPRTTYRFMVRAIGKYGSSKPLDESKSNEVKTGKQVGPPDDDQGLGEKTKIERSGEIANVIIGSKDFGNRELTIDLTRGNLAGSKEVILSIPAAVIAGKDTKDITIIGKDFVIKLNPKVFNVSRIEENKGRSDAGVRLRVAPHKGGTDFDGTQGGQTALSQQYLLEAAVFVGKDQTPLDYLKDSMQITLDFDGAKASGRRLTKIHLSRYDDYNKGWEQLAQPAEGNTAITTSIDRLGRYVVIGGRK